MICRRFARQTGFTLIELMVTVAIVAILATIAIPNYAQYIQRSRIVDATTRLSDMRVRMEQYFMDNRKYTSGGACGVTPPLTTTSDSFAITCAAADNPPTYTVTATGQASKSMGDFAYTITETGAKDSTKLPAGWAGTNSGCWVTKKDGTCGG